MAARSTVFAGIAGVLIIIGAGVFVVLRGLPAGETDDTPDRTSVQKTTPKIVPLEPHEAAMAQRTNPWPFEDFAADIDAASRPARMAAIVARGEAEGDHNRPLGELRFSLAVTDQRVQDIIPILNQIFAGSGTEIFTGPPYLPDDVRISFDVRDGTISDVFEAMKPQTDDRIEWEIVPRGLVIGTRNACVQARIDASEWEARIRARKSRPDDETFLVDYRPDFEGAHVGAVARDIRDKTGIETIVGRELWSKPLTLTWRSDPLPLSEALDELCERLRSNWYVYEGRIFLLAR